MVERIHVIDPDIRRRARVSHELSSYSVHAEIYEHIGELLAQAPTEGLILAADEAKPQGQHVREIVKMEGVELPVIGYAEEPPIEHVVEAMRAGATGFLKWPFESRDLINALRKMSEEGAERIRRERKLSQAKAQVETLSPRERQVLTALIAGMSNKEIAEALKISPRTVEIHRSKMMSRLRAQSVADAVRIGLFAGLDGQWESLHLTDAA